MLKYQKEEETAPNTYSPWDERYDHTSVVDNDGNIYVIGGQDGSYFNDYKNDVWRSSDQGVTWTQVAYYEHKFSERSGHASVVDNDGNIYVIGGKRYNSYKNDVWRSSGQGVGWWQAATGNRFSERSGHASVVDNDGNLYVIGGYDGSLSKNDVWRSSDQGVTWTQVATGNRFSERSGYASVVDNDGNIYVIGGGVGPVYGEVWRSSDQGVTWTQVATGFRFSERYNHTSVVDNDGNIYVIAGGTGWSNDEVWRSSDQGGNMDASSYYWGYIF